MLTVLFCILFIVVLNLLIYFCVVIPGYISVYLFYLQDDCIWNIVVVLLRMVMVLKLNVNCNYKIRYSSLLERYFTKTKSIDGTKPNTNPKTNPNPITNPIQLFCFFLAPSHRLQSSPEL